MSNRSRIHIQSPAKRQGHDSALKKIWKAGRWLLAGFVLIVGAIQGVKYLQESSKSPEEKFKEEKYFSGIFYGYADQKESDNILFDVGWFQFAKELSEVKSKKGYNLATIIAMADNYGAEAALELKFKLINERVFLHCDIRDLDNNIIANIHDSEWNIPKDLPHYADDSTLEILDRDNNVMLYLKYEGNNTFKIRGYFPTNIYTAFLNGGQTVIVDRKDSEYKRKCKAEASKLKPQSSSLKEKLAI
jgi:hypothetical protein